LATTSILERCYAKGKSIWDDRRSTLERRAELEKQLERMGGAVVRRPSGGSSLQGRKVPPKYRSPSGETWAGRGVKPRWLVDAIKGGKKIDDFLIEKSSRKGRKKA
jgi:DNA-binding protein H-NS